MLKLKRSLKNLELDINVAKTGSCTMIRVFPRQAVNSIADGEYPARRENPHVQNTAGPVHYL